MLGHTFYIIINFLLQNLQRSKSIPFAVTAAFFWKVSSFSTTSLSTCFVLHVNHETCLPKWTIWSNVTPLSLQSLHSLYMHSFLSKLQVIVCRTFSTSLDFNTFSWKHFSNFRLIFWHVLHKHVSRSFASGLSVWKCLKRQKRLYEILQDISGRKFSCNVLGHN